MTSSEKNSGGPTSLVVARLRVFEMLVQVLHHDDGGVHHGADGDGDAAQRQDVGVDALPAHDGEGSQNADGQTDQDDQRRPDVEQEQGADDDDHDEFLDQLVAQVHHRPRDQAGTVVGRDDFDACRQAAPQLFQLGLDRFDGGQGVLAGTHDDDAADHFALAVQFRRAQPQLRADPHLGHIAEQDRRTGRTDAQRHPPQVLHGLQIAARADHVFGLGHFDHRTADFLVRVLNRHPHLRKRQAVGAQPVGVEHHLILLDHAADRRDFCHAIDRL